MERIDSFRGTFYFLSNFYKCPVKARKRWLEFCPWVRPITLGSSEHWYQAFKADNEKDFERVTKAFDTRHAKKIGRTIRIREDWDRIKVKVMREVLMAKFSNPDLQTALVQTYPALLVEGNNWNDTIWGVCNGKGLNLLGELLMEVRQRLMPFRSLPFEARFSSNRLYRYTLKRVWGSEKRMIVFIGLNPSTANEIANDPTVTRCINYAKMHGFDGMYMLNIFAYRATNPDDMKKQRNPVGKHNDRYIEQVLSTAPSKIVAAWGNHGTYKSRSDKVRLLLQSHKVKCFGHTKIGEPKHPLYLPKDVKLLKM